MNAKPTIKAVMNPNGIIKNTLPNRWIFVQEIEMYSHPRHMIAIYDRTGTQKMNLLGTIHIISANIGANIPPTMTPCSIIILELSNELI
jgi:hypothetical protein